MMVEEAPQDAPTKIPASGPGQALLESLLGIHGASSASWLADAASMAAERGLGALYGLLYLTDASQALSGQRPASSARLRALVKLHQALDSDLTALRFDPRERPAVLSVLRDGHAAALSTLGQALPLPAAEEQLQDAQGRLAISEIWLAPLYWNGESSGLLLLLMPADPPASLAHAELLGRHLALALWNQREKEAGRKRGELDAVRWVYDEQRFLEELEQEARRAERHDRPLSILLLRVQNLEALRARYGRFLAERVLRHVANRLADAMRDTDFLGASGDDGFAAILVEADQQGARRAEKRLLNGLDKLTLPNVDLPELCMELAYATATLPQDGKTAEDLTAAAAARLMPGPTAQFEVASAG